MMDRRQFLKSAAAAGIGALITPPNFVYSQQRPPNITKEFLNKLYKNPELFYHPENSRFKELGKDLRLAVESKDYGVYPKVDIKEGVVRLKEEGGLTLVRFDDLEMFRDENLDGIVDNHWRQGYQWMNISNLPEVIRKQIQERYEKGLDALNKEVDKRIAEYLWQKSK